MEHPEKNQENDAPTFEVFSGECEHCEDRATSALFRTESPGSSTAICTIEAQNYFWIN